MNRVEVPTLVGFGCIALGALLGLANIFGNTSVAGLALAGVLIVIGGLVRLRAQPPQVLYALGVPCVALGLSIATLTESVTSYSSDSGVSHESSMPGLAPGIVMVVIGLALFGLGKFARSRNVQWSQVLDRLRQLTSAIPGGGPASIRAQGPVPPAVLHDALLSVIGELAPPGPQPAMYLVENKTGRIRLAYGAAATAPTFTLDINIGGTDGFSTADFVTLQTVPAGGPDAGFVGAAEHRRFVDYVRANLPLACPQVSFVG